MNVVPIAYRDTKDCARSADPVPADVGSSGELVMFLRVQSDQRTRAAKAGFAMHSDRSRLVFRDVEELIDDFPAGAGTVQEVQVDLLKLKNQRF